MTQQTLKFGFYPDDLELDAGPVTVRTLPDREETAKQVLASPMVAKDWVYVPLQQSRDFISGAVKQQPYAVRVFGLPKTHTITHARADGEDHLTFHLWCLSFFTGLRLTATAAGFLDATPVKRGMLVDFVPQRSTLTKGVEMAEDFWRSNAGDPRQAQRFAAAVHALFIAQNPQFLQFESFLYLYTALDACYALASTARPPGRRVLHAERTAWMCQLFGIPVPPWADPSAAGGAAVAAIRNDAVHEALFMDAPLGFALHGVGTNRNLTLEMEAMVCRLLVALIGGERSEYVRSPVDTRQRHGLTLS